MKYAKALEAGSVFILRSLRCFPWQLVFFRQLRPLILLEKWRSVGTYVGPQDTACKFIRGTTPADAIPKIASLTKMIHLRFGKRCWTRPSLTHFPPVIPRLVGPHPMLILLPLKGEWTCPWIGKVHLRRRRHAFSVNKMSGVQSQVTPRLFCDDAKQIETRMMQNHSETRIVKAEVSNARGGAQDLSNHILDVSFYRK